MTSRLSLLESQAHYLEAILEMLLNLSEPQIPHLLNKGGNSMSFMELLELSNGLIDDKCLTRYLIHN